MNNRERAEKRRVEVLYKKHAKSYGVWYGKRYFRKYERLLCRARNRDLYYGIPF